MTSTIDLAALARCLDVARRDPVEAARIDGGLAQDDGSTAWLDLATSAAFHCQMTALSLPPWRSPPMYGDVDRPRVDQHAAELLRRMLSSGLSRFEPDPIAALQRAEKRVAAAR